MRAPNLSLAVASLLCASLLAAACGSDPEAPIDQGAKSNVGSGTGAAGSGGGLTGGGGGGGTLEDPNTQGKVNYPAGPFGLELDNVVTNYQFLGLRNPLEVNYDTSKVETLSFHDYYNPTADAAKPTWLLVTASARWCTFCKKEASESAKLYAKYKEKGVEFLTVIFEDDANPPNPAGLNDLQIWTKSYKLAYPVGLDPKLQLGVFFNVSAAPFNMVLDLTTMKIKFKGEGALNWAEFDKVIAGG